MTWSARREHLIITEVGSDLIVYDEQANHLHTLPAPIASVWRTCDGVATVDQISIIAGMTPAQVQVALGQLREAGLIDGDSPVDLSAHDRRRFIKKAALGAAIVSVTAPMAASASSVVPAGSCWWLGGADGWIVWPANYAACRQRDSCFGGGQESGGGCYKWTVGPDDAFGGW